LCAIGCRGLLARLAGATRLAAFAMAGTGLAGSAGLAGCASGPAPPDWRLEASAALERAVDAQLSGQSRVASVEFDRARRELGRTGRVDLAAHGVLVACASRVAALDFSRCSAADPLRADLPEPLLAYADYLDGTLDGMPLPAARAALLPPAQQVARAAGADAVKRHAAIAAIEDPFSRLLAAAVALRDGTASPAVIATAIDTASERGWRVPLLAWLGVEKRRAELSGDPQAAGRLQRRIDRVLDSAAPRKPSTDAPAN
jgi:hypothetical protein